jgi:methionine sulfoxide reductase heme-binding subunit
LGERTVKARENSLLRHPLLNGWPVFVVIAGLSFAIILAGLAMTGTSTPEATVAMIRLSVQLASPWIYLAFVATALGQLFPSNFSSWLLRNRRYVGLAFAAGFGWQAVFITVLLALHGDYYATVLHDTAEFITRMLSYALLLALTVTSFFPVRRAMDPRHWRLLHRVGIWYFWAAIWVSYAETVMMGDTRVIAIVFVISGLFVLTLRCAAHLKKRSALVIDQPAETTTP